MFDRSTPEMPDTHEAHATEAAMGDRRISRSFLGYRRSVVDDIIERLESRVEDLEYQGSTMLDKLSRHEHEADETRHDLTRARAELRYWNDRASYVDSEVARARQRATEIEHAARTRAETVEADAQERSLQLVDRVCLEANAMLQSAREEAREMFLRYEDHVDSSQQRLEKLDTVRNDIARTMQGALQQFEDAVRQLDEIGPVRRIADALKEPEKRAPTFGADKAREAAKRFDEAAGETATASLSSPLPGVSTGGTRSAAATAPAEPELHTLKATIAEPATEDDDLEALIFTSTSTANVHEADEAFRALLAP